MGFILPNLQNNMNPKYALDTMPNFAQLSKGELGGIDSSQLSKLELTHSTALALSGEQVLPDFDKKHREGRPRTALERFRI